MKAESIEELRKLVHTSDFYKCEDEQHPRIHAKELDRFLGYKIPKIEVKLLKKYRAYDQPNDESSKKQHYKGTQTWIGLHPQILQTPYSDIYKVLELLKGFPIERIVDIGAGYGRVGLVMNSVFPNASFTGYEILEKRKTEGNRIFDLLGLENCELLLQNVLEDDFILPEAQVYFIYDFSEKNDICKILDQLAKRLNSYNFFLITKGDRIDYLLTKKYKQFWSSNGCLSYGELKIYSSKTNLEYV